jgi:hypothetical protein
VKSDEFQADLVRLGQQLEILDYTDTFTTPHWGRLLTRLRLGWRRDSACINVGGAESCPGAYHLGSGYRSGLPQRRVRSKRRMHRRHAVPQRVGPDSGLRRPSQRIHTAPGHQRAKLRLGRHTAATRQCRQPARFDFLARPSTDPGRRNTNRTVCSCAGSLGFQMARRPGSRPCPKGPRRNHHEPHRFCSARHQTRDGQMDASRERLASRSPGLESDSLLGIPCPQVQTAPMSVGHEI